MTDRQDDREDEGAPGTPAAPITRREFLGAAVVGAATLSIGCDDPITVADDGGGVPRDARGVDAPGDPGVDAGSDAGPAIEQVPEPEGATESADFPLGVASGDATASSAILWTHYSGTAPLQLVVWEMDGEAYARTVHVDAAAAVDGGYVHVDVTTLAAATRYRYAFYETSDAVRGARSPIGRFRTPAAAGASVPLRIGAVSCVSNTRAIETIGHAGGRDDLAFFMFLGDTTYNDGATTLAQYRDKWISNVERAELRALRGSTSLLATWDDHEFDNDWNPDSFPAGQRAAAIQTFFEHQPLRRDAASPDRVWKVMRWGATADVFVLDCRAERSRSANQYVSRAQMDWLKAELEASTARFKLIMNSVPIADYPGAFDLARNDRWEGFPEQRTEILQHIDDNEIDGVLWISGDFHLAAAGRVSNSGPGSTQIEVLAGPGAQSGNLLAGTLGGPQFDWASRSNNYMVLDLDPATGIVRLEWVDGSGGVLRRQDYTYTA